MANRLATEYVKTCLQLTEAEMTKFIQMFVEQGASLQVKVLENGNQEVVLPDDAGEEIVLSFERQMNLYVCQGTCRIRNKNLVNLMRKAVSVFKGDAIVHRIYTAYTMIYTYKQGAVVKIVEKTENDEKVIFEFKDTIGQLEQLFHKNEVEQEIKQLKAQVNHLLDLRNEMAEASVREQIDARLRRLTHRLFVLEA
ncbi:MULTISPECIES: non-ribosomal peptide synthetase module [unclassified Paenibacillus]|uniref:non-ribosomal peptide synthetase module n=1 Tax=unclassified Paenibacillus TaxID=185978 RepID=UPI001AE550B6|nr:MULTISPECIES: non-ribosomal peptide synthetase module [unclassified Paenibacillus]MBP1156615.1 pyruvate/2-oxoacid:ferredoxin oxidoreductase beta subunit [Paenibacillus sp. PvP091]MBP1172647.1 pyruvate/2-oxoacid:ferredoxin oxidoreductase beta subunit [Paenibacillus sp. PvR098]MBP2439027.1 pyruvate/2-oxoacid:ferredoxin oxidoreductase beta subunit [Paenibacillus sp. PvP052]